MFKEKPLVEVNIDIQATDCSTVIISHEQIEAIVKQAVEKALKNAQ